MTPFFEEILLQPVELKCGAVVMEWQGKHSDQDVDRLNYLCSYAEKKFWEFIKNKGFDIKRNRDFHFQVSLLADGTGYRQLNDLRYRFQNRFGARGKEVWGYVYRDTHYLFVFNDVDAWNFDDIFIHELFHALSIYYGLFDSHSNKVDEQLALEFETRYKL